MPVAWVSSSDASGVSSWTGELKGDVAADIDGVQESELKFSNEIGKVELIWGRIQDLGLKYNTGYTRVIRVAKKGVQIWWPYLVLRIGSNLRTVDKETFTRVQLETAASNTSQALWAFQLGFHARRRGLESKIEGNRGTKFE